MAPSQLHLQRRSLLHLCPGYLPGLGGLPSTRIYVPTAMYVLPQVGKFVFLASVRPRSFALGQVFRPQPSARPSCVSRVAGRSVGSMHARQHVASGRGREEVSDEGRVPLEWASQVTG